MLFAFDLIEHDGDDLRDLPVIDRNGEKRDQATAARLKGTGVVGGFPDLMFFGIKGEVCCVELNAEGGRLSES